ncbi:MAG: hypothetical protein HYZ11_00405 [Candidatus Tectomicrobia bacterium]|uniref:Uncharacterized protein n=1 Tax=Tectimicrobiota bacterium TaxID=2528274 RepID=A0A932HYG5_UNCTE|nr:hypothetical protein [Candidatus Tectomicrobia bacterium]
MILGFLPPLAVLAGLGVGAYSLHAGLLILVFFGPFFTLLHEMSSGSALYFLWPFALCGVMAVSILCRESAQWVREHDGRAWGRYLVVSGLLAAGVALAAGWASGLFASLLFDTGLQGFGAFLSNRTLLAVSLPALGVLLAFLGFYFRAMRRREGRVRFLDIVVAGLLIYGVFQVGNTAFRSGYLFSGLQGFRYYFFMVIVYFLARYSIRTDAEARRILIAFGFATLAGAAQMLTESYLLNVAKVPHQQLPWVGHLTKNWEFEPDCGRPFITGCAPLGPMYMTHISGLLGLMGAVLWLPGFLAARRWNEGLGRLALAAFLLLAAFWTSRTVLLLLFVSFGLAAFLVRSSWVKALSGAAGLVVFLVFASQFLIPGLRYDFFTTVYNIPTRTIPDLLRAARVDVSQMAGKLPKNTHQIRDSRLKGWEVRDDKLPEARVKRSDGIIRKVDKGGMKGGWAVEVIPPLGGIVYFQFFHPSPNLLRGQNITIGAWLRGPAPNFMRLTVKDNLVVGGSAEYSGSGDWEFIILRHTVGKMSDFLQIELVAKDVGKPNLKGLVDGIYLVTGGEVQDLMGKPENFPWEKFLGLHREGKEKKVVEGLKPEETKERKVVDLQGVLATRKATLYRLHHYLLGRGASFGAWDTLFFPKGREAADSFQAVSYSDVELLPYFEQFGAVGLALFLISGLLPFGMGLRLSWRAPGPPERAMRATLTLIVFLGYAAMIHLSSMSRVGVTSIVYMAMAILVLKEGKRADA